jgi:glutathione peroxidase-family protein
VDLYSRLAQDGLEIIAFPCNQFFQERGTNEEILEFVKDKGVTFPMTGKVDCSRSDSGHPLFRFLTDSVQTAGFMSTVFGTGLKWNFSKFLCDKNGIPVKRFEPNVLPLDIEPAILELLAAK